MCGWSHMDIWLGLLGRKKEKRGKKYWIQFTIGYLTDYQSKPHSFYVLFHSFYIWQKTGQGQFLCNVKHEVCTYNLEKRKIIFSVFLTSKSAGGRNQQHLFVILWPGTAKSTLNEPADLSYGAVIANPNYNIPFLCSLFSQLIIDAWTFTQSWKAISVPFGV
jgi:hypothetical protein